MFTFACGSIEGLTLNQKRETLTALKKSISMELAARRALKVAEKEQKAFNVAMKREVAISRAQARLQKLLDKASPVGKKAIKANKKPSVLFNYNTILNNSCHFCESPLKWLY